MSSRVPRPPGPHRRHARARVERLRPGRPVSCSKRSGWRSGTRWASLATSTRTASTSASSLGEFTVAKEQNVRLRSGWFSDRSATYLAAGRPVVTQDTGFGAVLPTGEGLCAFPTLDEAAAAIEAVEADYSRRARAAAEIAREPLRRGDRASAVPLGPASPGRATVPAGPRPFPAGPRPRAGFAPPDCASRETIDAVLAGDISRLRTHSRSDARGQRRRRLARRAAFHASLPRERPREHGRTAVRAHRRGQRLRGRYEGVPRFRSATPLRRCECSEMTTTSASRRE